MKAIRLTKAERDFIYRVTGTAFDWTCFGTKAPAVAAGLAAKVRAAEEAIPGVDIGPLQAVLVKAASGKVLELEGGHGVASRRATALKVTAEDLELVGKWLARTSYFTQPMTILDVFNKWYQWLPKARATEPPPSLPSGLGSAGKADGTGQGPAAAGKATSRGRQAPGFR